MKPPSDLAKLQKSFGHCISRPLEFTDGDGNYTLSFDHYDPLAVREVNPRGDQTSAERIGVYNQQYWFRLLTIMQEEFPLTEALLGTLAFNEFAMGYIHACPPDSPRLRDLSNRLSEHGSSEQLPEAVLNAIALERTYIETFDAGSLPVPGQEHAAELATSPLRFQPHFTLFEASHNVVALRRRVKNGEDVSMEDVEAAPAMWGVWRGNGVQAVELGKLQAQLLRLLYKGDSLVEACDLLQAELGDDDLAFVLANVQRWFAAWSTANWFAAPA